MHKYGEGDTAIGLENLKQRYKNLNEREKASVEQNLVFASRNKRLERGAGKIVMRATEKIDLFLPDAGGEDEDEEDERRQHIQTNVDRRINNRGVNKILDFMKTISE